MFMFFILSNYPVLALRGDTKELKLEETNSSTTSPKFVYKRVTEEGQFLRINDGEIVQDSYCSLGPLSGEYLIIYSASLSIIDPERTDPASTDNACGWGWIKLVSNDVIILHNTRRLFEAPTSGGIYSTTIVLTHRLSLNEGTASVMIYFSADDNEYLRVGPRSIIAIPLGQQYDFWSASQFYEWENGAYYA